MKGLAAEVIVMTGFALGMGFWIWGLLMYRRMKGQEKFFTRESENFRASPETMRKAFLTSVINQYQVRRASRGDLLLRVNKADIEVQIRPLCEGTCLRTDVDMTALGGLMGKIIGLFVFFLEPLVVIGLPLALWIYVVQDPRPYIRWQSIQVLQVIHVLWPPFLVWFLNSRLRKNVLDAVESLHHAFQLME